MTLAIIGGNPQRFRPYVDLYHDALERFGHQPQPIAVHSPGHVASTDEEARADVWPHYEAMMNRIGRERGWPPIIREAFLSEVRNGSQYVGSPETVARKIASTVRDLGLGRFSLKYSAGTTGHDHLLRSVELYGTQVIPRVRELLAQETADLAS